MNQTRLFVKKYGKGYFFTLEGVGSRVLQGHTLSNTLKRIAEGEQWCDDVCKCNTLLRVVQH